jgi:hypothetical protein
MFATPIIPFSSIMGGLGCPSNNSPEASLSTRPYPFQNGYQKRIPIKIIMNDDEEVISVENNNEETEDNSMYTNSNRGSLKLLPNVKMPSFFHKMFEFPEIPSRRVIYIFNILKSRKKEKKYLRKRYNSVISRVHNMDCLLKKIKA